MKPHLFEDLPEDAQHDLARLRAYLYADFSAPSPEGAAEDAPPGPDASLHTAVVRRDTASVKILPSAQVFELLVAAAQGHTLAEVGRIPEAERAAFHAAAERHAAPRPAGVLRVVVYDGFAPAWVLDIERPAQIDPAVVDAARQAFEPPKLPASLSALLGTADPADPADPTPAPPFNPLGLDLDVEKMVAPELPVAAVGTLDLFAAASGESAPIDRVVAIVEVRKVDDDGDADKHDGDADKHDGDADKHDGDAPRG